MNAWRRVAASFGIVAATVLSGPAIPGIPTNAGESIYLHGVLGSGAPLAGSREGAGTGAQGADAACVNCHQRSGLGSKEGNYFIPPITGDYLFQGHAHGGDDPMLPYVESMHGNRTAYTPPTLARAIREGVDADGRTLSSLMPRYALDDADMEALTEYLMKLSAHHVPGVTSGELHFATIVTPDADPVKRGAVENVLEKYVAEQNSFGLGPQPRMWTSGKTAYAKSMYMTHLRWRLHVWELTGDASTWREQLERHMHDEPAFAVLSGLGGSNWAPVHEFCEEKNLPCIFPNVEVPIEAHDDFYSLYFSKGVLLEAGLIASRIGAAETAAPRVVEQVYRAGDSGEAAARALAKELEGHGVTVRNNPLAPRATKRELAAAVRAAGKAQALVLWLRPADVAALGEPPPAGTDVYLSGLLGGLEASPLPASWRPRTFIAYPFDVPDKRGVRLDYAFGWFTLRRIPIVAPQVQADTYLACSLVSEALKQMADTMVPAYLVERLQGMIEHRLVTGYYPHLALAYHERFASKGGYIARFTGSDGKRLVADSDWIVP